MARNVDVDARRRELSDALWRIVRRDGMSSATVRAIAAEAGVSAGMVQHYFKTQDDLIEFAMGTALGDMASRVAQFDLNEIDAEQALTVAEEVLPLDEQRRSEAQVWLALMSRRHAGPTLEEQGGLVDSTLRDGVRRVLEGLRRSGAMSAERDLELEVLRAQALIDGLSLHALGNPPSIDPEQVRAVMRAHISDLANPPPQHSAPSSSTTDPELDLPELHA